MRPVLLVLEDVQWGDLPTVNLVDAALRELAELPWMVLWLGRPEMHERFPKLCSGRNAQYLQLGPLSRRACVALVRRALGAEVSEETAERLAVRSDGHAFFLEELIRTAGRGERTGMPDTVMAMVQARLGRLAVEERRVLRAASVLGEVFWRDGVAALLGETVTQAELGELLEQLEEREFIVRHVESRFAGEEEFAFRHALVCEGAHAMLTAEDLTTGHQLAAHFLEQVGESDPLVLAQHWEQGGQPERAAEFYLVAAERALVSGDGEAVLSHAQRGMAGARTPEVKGDLLRVLSQAHLFVRGEWFEGLRVAEETLAVAPLGSRSWYLAAGSRCLLLAAMGGETAEAEFQRLYETLVHAVPAPEAMSAFAETLGYFGYGCATLGWYDRARRLIEKTCQIVEPVSEREPSARASMHLLRASIEGVWLGDPWHGLEWAEQAARSFEAIGLGSREEVSWTIAGRCAGQLGSLDRALGELRRPCKFKAMESFRRLFLIDALRAGGAWGEARAELELLHEHALTAVDQGVARMLLAEVLLGQGALESAEREARAALALLTAYPPCHAFSLATLARTLLAAGRTEEALASAAEAMAGYDRLAPLELYAMRARLVHAEALHAAGEVEQARASLARTARRLEELAAWIEDPDWRRSYLEKVEEHARILALTRSWGLD